MLGTDESPKLVAERSIRSYPAKVKKFMRAAREFFIALLIMAICYSVSIAFYKLIEFIKMNMPP